METLLKLAQPFGLKGTLLAVGVLAGLGLAKGTATAQRAEQNSARIGVLEGERVDVARLTVQLEATNGSVSSLQLQITALQTDIRELRTELRRRP
jgi:TolA-binding protein